MKTKALKLISSDYLKQYSKKYRLDLTTTKKSIFKEFSVRDFDHYAVASSVFSSNIEGGIMDLNSFYKNRNELFRGKEVREIETLANAYKFASKNKLNQESFLQAHKILSTTLIPFFGRGKYRKTTMFVMDARTGDVAYTAIEWNLVPEKMNELFSDINYLIKSKLSDKEVFYYASMIHLWVANIHPFRDGNGRSARLIEKWFLVSKLGKPAWSIPSERYYWTHLGDYYKKIALGENYYFIHWNKCLPFLLMLPKALKSN